MKIPPQNPSPTTFVKPIQQLSRMVELVADNKLKDKERCIKLYDKANYFALIELQRKQNNYRT
jgi:hypothetical protein